MAADLPPSLAALDAALRVATGDTSGLSVGIEQLVALEEELALRGFRVVDMLQLGHAGRCVLEDHAGALEELTALRKRVRALEANDQAAGDATLATLLDVALDAGRFVLEHDHDTGLVTLTLAEDVTHRRRARWARQAVSLQALRDRLVLGVVLRELRAKLDEASEPLQPLP